MSLRRRFFLLPILIALALFLAAPQALASCGAAPTAATTDTQIRLKGSGSFSTAVAIGTPAEGDLAYDATNHLVAFCNGSSWVDMGAATLTGSGTQNYVARWTGSTALGTGVLYDNGSAVGIGTTNPIATLFVQGNVTTATPGLQVISSGGGSSANWYDPANYAGTIFNANNSTQRYGLLVSDYWRSTENSIFAVDGRTYVNGTVSGDSHSPYFVVNGTGNVGAGIAAPTEQLETYNATNGEIADYVYNNSTGASTQARFSLATGTANSYVLSALLDNSGSPYYLMSAGSGVQKAVWQMPSYNFETSGGTSELYISGGDVGIGTASPNSTLEVVGGAINFTNATSEGYGTLENDGGLHLAADSTTNGGMYLSAPAGFAFRNTYAGTATSFLSTTAGNSYINASGGNVGIGTASPGSTLDVYGPIYLKERVALDTDGTNTYVKAGAGGGVYTQVNGSTTAMFVNPSGYVGIGTTGPTTTLTVVGPGNTAPTLTTNNGAFTVNNGYDLQLQVGQVNIGNAGVYMQAKRVSNDGTAWQLYLNPLGGNVGIGSTSPLNKLDVAGTIAVDSLQANTGTLANFLSFGASSGEGIASKRSSGGNQYGLDFWTGSNIRMSVTNSGNVGIGTTGPAGPLHIYAATGLDVISDAPSSNSSVVELRRQGTQYADLAVTSAAGAWSTDAAVNDAILRTQGGKLLFNTNGGSGASTLAINGGNVGIGTTAPGSNQLSIAAVSTNIPLAFTANNSGAYPASAFGGAMTMNYNTGNGDVGFWNTWVYPATVSFTFNQLTGTSSAKTLMTILENGNVGIGTNYPYSNLHVSSASNSAYATVTMGSYPTAGYYSQIAQNANYLDITANGDESYRVNLGTNNGTGIIRFFTAGLTTGNTERMRIDYAGNVGIGTTSPNFLLDVNGNARVYAQLQISGSYSVGWPLLGFNAVYNGNGSGGFTNTYAGYSGVIETMQDNGRIAFETNGSTQTAAAGFAMYERLDILQNGNVGIGSTVPVTTLDVGGELRAVNEDLPGSGGFLGFNVYYNNNWLYRNSDTGYVIRDDGGDMGFYTVTSGTAGNVASPTQRMYIPNGGNLVVIGTGTTCTIGSGTGATNCTSDERLKKDIAPIPDALAKIGQLKGVTFHWKDPAKAADEHIGVIAQDVEKVFPQAVGEVKDQTLGAAKTVDIAALVAPLIEAVKELKSLFDGDHEVIAKLKAANDNLRAANDDEAAQIKALTARLDRLEAARR